LTTIELKKLTPDVWQDERIRNKPGDFNNKAWIFLGEPGLGLTAHAQKKGG